MRLALRQTAQAPLARRQAAVPGAGRGAARRASSPLRLLLKPKQKRQNFVRNLPGKHAVSFDLADAHLGTLCMPRQRSLAYA
jgi:hypothetical protein